MLSRDCHNAVGTVEMVVRHDVVREHGRSERAANARDLLTDVAAPHDAHGRGGELTPDRLPPNTLADLTRKRHELSRERDHHRDRKLGDGLTIDARRPPDRDAMSPR